MEPWCADFVSWVYKEAGHPLKNPNSGSWRIPGTYTLREYYEAQGAFRPADSGYEPQLGDVAIYEDSPGFRRPRKHRTYCKKRGHHHYWRQRKRRDSGV